MRMHPIMMKAALEFFQKSILRNLLEGRNGMATGAPLISHCHQPAIKVTQRPQGHVCCRGLVRVQSGSGTTEAKSWSAHQGAQPVAELRPGMWPCWSGTCVTSVAKFNQRSSFCLCVVVFLKLISVLDLRHFISSHSYFPSYWRHKRLLKDSGCV